jgi:hypothetical protein
MQPQAASDGVCDDKYLYRAFRPSFGERVKVTALKLERVPVVAHYTRQTGIVRRLCGTRRSGGVET